MSKNHSPNCTCQGCTQGDSYIKHLRSNFGKNAAWNQFGGVTPERANFNNFDMSNADALPGFQPLPTGPAYGPTNQANLKSILGDALGNVVGDLIQAKKDGQQLPPLLDKVAGLGIKVEQSAKTAATEKAYSETGRQVVQFSPIIIGVLIGAFVLLVYFVTKK